MTLILSLIPLFLVPFFYALFVKLAALLLRRTILSWKHAISFGGLAIAIGALGTAINYASGRLLPPLLTVLLGVATQLAFGGWYLGPRAQSSEGNSVGFVRGIFIALIAVCIFLSLGVAVTLLFPQHQTGVP